MRQVVGLQTVKVGETKMLVLKLVLKHGDQFRMVRVLVGPAEFQARKEAGTKVPVSYQLVSGAGQVAKPSQRLVSESLETMVDPSDIVEMTPVTVRGFGRGGLYFEGSHAELRGKVEYQLRLRDAGGSWTDIELWMDDTFRKKMSFRPDRIQICEEPKPWPGVTVAPPEKPADIPLPFDPQIVRVDDARRARSPRPRAPRRTRVPSAPSVPPPPSAA
jgi:hypothetical protein